jgi:hypothetical protein
MSSEGYTCCVGRGGLYRLGSEGRTSGKRQEGAVLKNNLGGTQRGV